jgi:hypothetical protein
MSNSKSSILNSKVTTTFEYSNFLFSAVIDGGIRVVSNKKNVITSVKDIFLLL